MIIMRCTCLSCCVSWSCHQYALNADEAMPSVIADDWEITLRVDHLA